MSTSTTDNDDVDELPPSAKFVVFVLEREGELTQEELFEQTRLPKRTVRYALGILDEKGLVTARTYMPDARKSVYSLDDEGDVPDT